jgi:hexokinase
VELAGHDTTKDEPPARRCERSWPILDHLKNQNAESLFAWIGECIVEVVRNAHGELGTLPVRPGSGSDPDPILPMGVTFSFPMNQRSLADAALRSMGKGFAITDGTDLASSLLDGYEKARTPGLPRIKIVAITNDSVATLIAFIVGTGCNATAPLRVDALHQSKYPTGLNVRPEDEALNGKNGVKVAVNTEWSINGSAGPLRSLGFITRWDDELDATSQLKGFQPLEYMTAGRYLGELARLVFLDYLSHGRASSNPLDRSRLPPGLLQSYALDTTWLSSYKPSNGPLIDQLRRKFSDNAAAGREGRGVQEPFQWTEEAAEALYHIAQAIQRRAAGLVAAAVVGLLRVTGEIPLESPASPSAVRTLGVGYTGGCIANFHDYLRDAQAFLDEVIRLDFGDEAPVRVALTPCNDGGVIGAGILCAAALL